MPNSTQEEKLRWIKPILDGKISVKDMALVCPFSERALKYWLSRHRQYGLDGLMNRSTRPRSQPGETPIRVKERVLEFRRETGLCAQKLYWKLKKEGLVIHVRTIGKILKAEGVVRRYHSRKPSPPRPKTLLQLGELVEIDVKYVPELVESKRMYQFTAIDCASRWRYVSVSDDLGNYGSIRFLKELLLRCPFPIQAIKTDNAPGFTNRYTGYQKSTDPQNPRIHPFDDFCLRHDIIHYLIDRGKPQQNGHVERSHRTDQEHFYDTTSYPTADDLKYQLRLWNMYYNDLEHCSLDGLTPNEYLKLRVQNVRT